MAEEQHNMPPFLPGEEGASFDPFEIYVAELITEAIRGTQTVHAELKQHIKRVLWSHIGFCFLLVIAGIIGPISAIVSLDKIRSEVHFTAQEVEKTSQLAMESTRVFRMLHADDELANQRDRVLLDRIKTVEDRLSLGRERTHKGNH